MTLIETLCVCNAHLSNNVDLERSVVHPPYGCPYTVFHRMGAAGGVMKLFERWWGDEIV